ncbi:MAG: hypothetical protein ABJA70_20595, partial [Chryseolinea sp.]
NVLAQRQNFIHSDSEFRTAFQTLFSVDLSTCPPLGPPTTRSAQIPSLTNTLYERIPFRIIQETLQREVNDRAMAILKQEQEYKVAVDKSASIDATKIKDDEQVAIAFVEPLRLKTMLELSRLLQSVNQRQLRSLKMGDTLRGKNIQVFDDSIKRSTFEFEKRAKDIAIENISAAVKMLTPFATTTAAKTIVAQLNRTLHQLKLNSVGDVNVFRLFEVPISYSDDTTSEYSKPTNWWIWIAIFLLITLLIFWSFRKRAP